LGDIVLQADGLGKRYTLGTGGGVVQRLKAAVRGEPDGRTPAEEFWALREVSFAIERGQIVGVIGRNGAGKSTLLKILSRITAPTTGEVHVTGRISSLLEVGTGFQPELTGRENVYLNGSILGMDRPEIDRKFDEIVAFSELEKFLDTPVKRYSSGMYMRLAFAVAAHLDPDILILDEVLSVGDSAFHQKCIGKMGQVAGAGRTVLLVSHNLPSILALCDRCLLLEQGRLVRDGPTTEVAVEYETKLTQGGSGSAAIHEVGRLGSGQARMRDVELYSMTEAGERSPFLVAGRDLWVEVTVAAAEGIKDCELGFNLFSSTNDYVIDANLSNHGKTLTLGPGEKARVTFRLRDVLLKPNVYRINLWLGKPGVEAVDWIKLAGAIGVQPEPGGNPFGQFAPGYYRCRYSTEIRRLEGGE
jgi:lipopolysaccharide transport system ATP-binding protein